MAYVPDEAPASLSDIVGIMGLFYLALLVTVVAVGPIAGGDPGQLLPALDASYASNFTA